MQITDVIRVEVSEKNVSDAIAGEKKSMKATLFNNGRCSIKCSYKVQGTNYTAERITDGLSPGSSANFNIIYFVPDYCSESCAISAHITCNEKPDQCQNPRVYETDVSFDLIDVASGVWVFLRYIIIVVIIIVPLGIIYFGFKFISGKLGGKPKDKGKGEAEGRRKLSAIIFTDMKGFSKEMEMDEEATLKKLWRYEKPMKEIIREHEGRVVKTIGDAIMGDFDSAVNAVKAAMEIQNLLKKEDIKIRIGIHLGDVIHKAGDIFGDGVNIASRIESICEPGEIYISEDVYNQVRGKIKGNFESLGRKPLKNIDVPPRVYRIKS